MKALLQLQWSLHKSSIWLTITAVLILGFLFYNNVNEMALISFALAFTINSVTLSKRIFTDSRTELLLYAMPISRATLIKNLYVTNFLLCSIIYLLILPMQIVGGLAHNELTSYSIALFGFYGGSLIGTAYHLSFQLKDLSEDSWLDSLLSIGAGMFVIVVPHMLLSFIEHAPTFWLRLLIMPIVSLILYRYLMNRGIRKFSDRELL